MNSKVGSQLTVKRQNASTMHDLREKEKATRQQGGLLFKGE